jgi:hypothetical protein
VWEKWENVKQIFLSVGKIFSQCRDKVEKIFQGVGKMCTIKSGKIFPSAEKIFQSEKPKTFKIGSDCSFAKSTAFRSENHRSFRYDKKMEVLCRSGCDT